MRARTPQAVQLSLDDLLSAIGFSGEVGFSRRQSWPALRLPPGSWSPPLSLRWSDVTLLVISGGLVRRCPYGTDVLLRGDASRIESPALEHWRVLSHSSVLAVLNPATVGALFDVQGAAHAVLRAMHAQHERGLDLRSIAARYGAGERIVWFFAYLAGRVGRPEGQAVRIALDLDQKRIEEIVGVGHTQGSASFRALIDAGVLVRDAGGWMFFKAQWKPHESRPSSSVPNLSVARSSSVPNSLVPVGAETLALGPVPS